MNGLTKIIEAEDILAKAQNCVDCIFLAAGGLSSESETGSFQTVADIASTKIAEALALLDEYVKSTDTAGGTTQ